MAEKVMIQQSEGSPEFVAYKLLLEIASIEGGYKDRKTVLDAYAECLHATRGYRDFPSR